MKPPHAEVEILLGVDGTFRRVPLASISAVTRVPVSALRESFSRLVFALTDHDAETTSLPEGAPTEGEARNDRLGDDRNVPEKQEPETFSALPIETIDVPAVAIDLSGEVLARVLDDEASLPFYDQLVARTAPAVLTRALDLTLTHRSTIRSRPAAYFVALVRRFTSNDPYARTKPTPT